jgi:membrane protein
MRIDLPAFEYLLSGKFWVAIWKEINKDDCWGMAAQLSYYFLLAFFPFLIFLSALVGFLPLGADPVGRLMYELNSFVPEKTYALVNGIFESLVESRDQGLLTLGIALALWFASWAFNGMISLLNQAYQVPETRSYWRTRSLSILVTVIVSVFMIMSGVLLFFGEWLITLVIEPGPLKTVSGIARWVLAFLLLNFGVQIIYFALPAHRFPAKLVSPGGVVAAVGFIVGSLAFRSWVNAFFPSLQRLYGSLGALIGLMVWFYICSLFLVVGGEIDSEIYKIRHRIRSAYGSADS